MSEVRQYEDKEEKNSILKLSARYRTSTLKKVAYVKRGVLANPDARDFQLFHNIQRSSKNYLRNAVSKVIVKEN